ncbi:hypothetical protein HYC85_019218 [Camellia sinensis]|uniref:Uncharacterized protein n=1 Tax=Camellia sinensis TaxID=4442 RepID=A0A7J7GQ46_CAMSI|nr:hypothetical protein HYC85_019218 [Camellia sinensis]
MAEAFPNQVPFVLSDDSPSGSSAHERECHTPEMPHQYEHFLEKISKLESELSCAQEEIRCLNSVVLIEIAKLKSAEEKCVLLETSNQSLRLEAENLVKKIAMKDQQLSEKHEELEKLQACVQDEQLRFVQVEATPQTLQNLHSQSQQEQNALALELKNGLQMLKDLEICKHDWEEEIRQVKEENRNMNELNSSFAISVENQQSEILKLREMKERLKEEVGLQMGQTNSLLEEISHLKEEIKDLNKRYQALMEQVESVGLNPECIASSVRYLQDENPKLRQICKEDRDDKEALFKKLENMEQLLEKNVVLESSLSDLSSELKGSQANVKALQESCQSLHGEKSALVSDKAALLSQLQIITENMQKILGKNTVLENSLFGANVGLEGLREKSKSLEELCKSLNNDQSNLIAERGTLVVQLDNVEWRLENLEMRFAVLEQKYASMEKEKESTLSQVEELKVSLGVEKQERASFALSSGARLACLENHIQLFQEETRWRKKEFEEELDKAMNVQFEIFVLQKFIQDMEQKNYTLLVECQKHVEASKLTEKLVSELESENLEQQVEAGLLLDQIEKLRMGIYQVFKALEIGQDNELDDEIGGLKARLFAYAPAIDSLSDNIASLEHNILSLPELNVADNQEQKTSKSCQEPMEDHNSAIPNRIPELQNLQTRMKAVEQVVPEEKKKLVMQKSLNTNIKLDAALKEFEELKSNYSVSLKKDKQMAEMELRDELVDRLKLQKTKPEISEVRNGILMKDIPFDHVSDSSLNGISRSRNRGADDQMLELWEAAEDGCGLDRTLKESQKQANKPTEDDTLCQEFEHVEHKNENHSSELQVEKELGVDRLEAPTCVPEPHQDQNKKKILERLDSDTQMLKNPMITVEDLRRKLEMNKKRKKAKRIDFETVKEQLQEVEETIVQLVEVNGQLSQNIEESPLHLDGNASPELEEAGDVQRKRVLEQARKGSEKIGRLQLEVQKIHYVLLKLLDEKKNNEKSRFSRSKTT